MITVSHYLELADVSWCIADTIIGETRDDMALYFIGHAKPNYPVPTVIGFVPSGYGTYMIDTRKRMDGMPLFRGYTWEWWTPPI